MKNLMTIAWICGVLLTLAVQNTVYAQREGDTKPDREFLVSDVSSFSGFGGPFIEFSSIDGDFAVSNGGGGALLINQELFFGGYGLSLSNTISQVENNGLRTNLDFDHGGFFLGYIFNTDKMIHWTVSSKIGWGDLSLDQQDNGELFSDNVFVFTPEAAMEINVNYWFKINAGLGIRMAAGVDNDYYNNADLLSPTGNLSFLFGWFKE